MSVEEIKENIRSAIRQYDDEVDKYSETYAISTLIPFLMKISDYTDNEEN